MYSNKFVISILVNGQVQKEFANGDVNLPFGTEYAIRFRNKNDRQAVVKLYIDGEKMCRSGFVIPPNSYRDIECSSQTLRKFKFVDLQSTEAQDHGKDQVNAEKLMGVVEAHWYLEKAKPVVKEIHHHHNHHYPVPQPYPVPVPRPWPWRHPDYYYTCNANARMSGFESCSKAQVAGSPEAGVLGDPPASMMPASTCAVESVDGAAVQRRGMAQAKAVRDGATVEGSYSSQRFGDMNVDLEENATVLRLQLKGYDPVVLEVVENGAEVPLVDHGPKNEPATETRYCDKCGAKVAKKSSRFCHQCGNKFD